MHPPSWGLWLACALSVALTCKANRSSLDPSDYNQSCTLDSDCVTVAVGIAEDACCSQCEQSAINRSALSQFDDDRAGFCSSLTGHCSTDGQSCPLAPA